jgi:hypothetical protein
MNRLQFAPEPHAEVVWRARSARAAPARFIRPLSAFQQDQKTVGVPGLIPTNATLHPIGKPSHRNGRPRQPITLRIVSASVSRRPLFVRRTDGVDRPTTRFNRRQSQTLDFRTDPIRRSVVIGCSAFLCEDVIGDAEPSCTCNRDDNPARQRTPSRVHYFPSPAFALNKSRARLASRS